DRQHCDAGGGLDLAVGAGGEAPGDRGKLRRQFLAVALRRVQGARTAGAEVGRISGLHMRDDENLTAERPTFVTHLECSATGEQHRPDVLHNLSHAGKPLLVRYDLAGVQRALSKEALARRPRDFWRYRELLPVRHAKDIVSLGEAVTPLLAMPRLAARL